jgi:hypothetical protein
MQGRRRYLKQHEGLEDNKGNNSKALLLYFFLSNTVGERYE